MVVERVRSLTFWENVTLNEDCRVVVARAGSVVIELGVLSPEVTAVLSALAVGTGGGWRSSAANIGEHDVADKQQWWPRRDRGDVGYRGAVRFA